MLQKQRKIIEFSGSMILSAVVFLLIYKFIPIVYATNDDRMIAEIISGQFSGTPEAYAIQMSYGFTWFLSKLYEVTNDLNWYGIALLGTQILSFGSMLYRLQSFGKKWTEKLCILAASIGLFLALWLKVYVQMTYTSTAAFVGLAAIFWYATSKTNWKNCLMAGILANLAFCIRPNVFYMLVPATGLVYLWKIFGKKEQTKLTIAAPFLILAVTAGLFFVNSVAYAKPEWKEFMAFFDDRTQIYDYYDLADFEDHPELYEPYGIDKTEYDMIRVYNYTTMGEEPKTFFPEYIAAYEEMEQREGITFTTKAVNAVKTFFKDVFTGEYGVENTVLFLAAAVLLFVSFMKKCYLLSLYLGTQWAANVMLWLYFTYWQRAIDRIQISMSLIFLAVILHVLYELCQVPEGEEAEQSNKKAGSFVILFVLVGIFVFAGNNFMKFRYENIAKANRYRDVQTIQEYCAANPERLYLMDVATMTELYGRMTIGALGPEYINYIQLGDWSAYCPHYEEKLVRHGVDQMADAVTGENTYVIMLHNYQVQCMKDYLGVEEQWVETIFGANDQAYAVYRFEK